MDAITQLQQQLAEPVNGFIGAYWPFVLVIVIATVIWFFAPPRWRNSDGDMSTDGDGDSGGDGGGDGGGGD